jgi:catecholate siderophore receptor
VDSIRLDPHWVLDGGLRWDEFHSYFSEATTNSYFSRTDSEVSPRLAVIYQPDRDQSYYLSYGTSYNPAIEYLVLAPTSNSLTPEQDRTYELGAKWQLLDQKLSVTGAVFYTRLTNARIADPGDPTVQQLPFNQEVKGLELGASGYLTEEWEIRASYTHLDDRIVASSDPLAIGKFVPNTPHDAYNLWNTFELTPAWTLGGGIYAMSHRYADTDNTAGVASFATFNVMASYRCNKYLTVQVNLNNLTNKLYYTSLYYSAADENHAVPAAGFAAVVMLSARLPGL